MYAILCLHIYGFIKLIRSMVKWSLKINIFYVLFFCFYYLLQCVFQEQIDMHAFFVFVVLVFLLFWMLAFRIILISKILSFSRLFISFLIFDGFQQILYFYNISKLFIMFFICFCYFALNSIVCYYVQRFLEMSFPTAYYNQTLNIFN